MSERQSWDEWYLDLARFISKRSRDPRTKVGAVIARPDHTQVSFGYNGFPKGVQDLPERYENRELKLQFVRHAEENAFDNARENVAGCTLYVTPYHPCARCAGAIVSKGIKRVVTDMDMANLPEHWKENMEIASTILCEGGVEVVSISEKK